MTQEQLPESMEFLWQLFQQAEIVQWQDAESMWQHLMQTLNCSKERAQVLGKQVAFVSPFRGDGTWRGAPTLGTCPRCGQTPLARDVLCGDHAEAARQAGPGGEYRYSLFCAEGRTRHEEPFVMDDLGVPRCRICHKSMLKIPINILRERESRREHALHNTDQEAAAAKRKKTRANTMHKKWLACVAADKKKRADARIAKGLKPMGRPWPSRTP